MPKNARFLAIATALVTGLTVVAAQDALDLPTSYSPRLLDSRPVVVTDDLTGTAWSAWTYRVRGESDIALSFRGSNGEWTEPVFIGAEDRRDQIQPALQRDDNGNVYLAYVVRQTGAIHTTALAVGREGFFAPTQVTGSGERASSPTLRVVGDRLVMAYRSGRQVKMLDWAMLGAYTPSGIQEGPEGFPSIAVKQDDPSHELPGEDTEEETSGGLQGNTTGSGG
jgi:hypothetical protein